MRRKLAEKTYKQNVEETNEYEYIESYFKGDILPNGVTVRRQPYIKIRHLYCGSIYIIQSKCFINEKRRCTKCCISYEKSFAYHIEQELNEPLEKYWDFEKNVVNPYHIYKNYNGKVWIKCQDKDYHDSYEVACNHFANGSRCSYCYGKKTHPYDSFGQYLKDNKIFHLWSDKNVIDPFTLSICCKTKVFILCEKKDYHNDYGGYEISCLNFVNGKRCSYCHRRKVHIKDSFGISFPNRVKNWHNDNKKSPYEVAKKSKYKYKFVCDKCNHVWEAPLYCVAIGVWCPSCNISKGESRVLDWLTLNSIEYKQEVKFDELVSDLNINLRYDFYLPEYNILIEYDGLQHDKWIESWMPKDLFIKLQYHDRLKNEYAKNNDITLIRIKEKDFNNIEKILSKELNI